MRPSLLALLALLSGCPAPPEDALPRDAGTDGPDGIPVAPILAPEPPTVSEWMVSAPTDKPDPTEEALDSNTLAYPVEGVDSRGLDWTRHWADDAGGLSVTISGGVAFALARVTPAPGRHLYVQSGPSIAVYSDGRRQPGDIYNFRKLKAPARGDETLPEHLVAVELAGGRGEARIDVWQTPDELLLNLDDLTFPDLVVGDATERWLGVPVLNLSGRVLHGIRAQIVGDPAFEVTSVEHAPIAADAVTQLAFRVKPRVAFSAAAEHLVRVRVESPELPFAYEREVKLSSVGAGTPYRLTRRSGVDGSVQYAGVQPPTVVDPTKTYALVLSLHGAGVDAIGQAQSYSSKDWIFHVAPTNRRPFGFDWEEWGRLDGLEALDDAMSRFPIDPTRVYLSGHSMGGHGTWQLGVHATSRFAVVAPSAGWSSFQTYTGRTAPSGWFARAQASSTTNNYVSNLSNRAVFIIHGSADNVVPVREARDMRRLLNPFVSSLSYYEEPGAGHWWDDPETPGADCIDWPPLFALMKDRRVDPDEAAFTWRTPSPWVTRRHSFATLQSETSPAKDVTFESTLAGDTITVTTTNARSFELDTAALGRKGVKKVVVDGEQRAVEGDAIRIGPATGKTAAVHGPFNQVFHRPFCFVHGDDPAAREAVAYLVSYWAFVGNGQACAMELSKVTDAVRADRNLVWVGVPSAEIGVTPLPAAWSADAIELGGARYTGVVGVVTFPANGRVNAAIFATKGSESLYQVVMPFGSGSAWPDYLVYGGSLKTSGFFDAEWKHDKALATP